MAPVAALASASPAASSLREAREFARAGDARARDRFLKALARAPSDVSLRAEIADYFWSVGDPTEAESQMDWLVEKGHPKPGFLRYYGLRLFESGNYEKASRILERALGEAHPDYDLLFCLGAARLEKGDFSGAEKSLREAIRADSGPASAHHLLGKLLNLRLRHDEAAAELRRAAEAEPGSAAIGLDFAQALAAANHPEEAEAACRKSIERQGDNAAAHLTLGQILRSEGRKDEAAAELAVSRKLYDREEERVQQNRSSGARTSEGWVLQRKSEDLERAGRREEAIRALEEAKKLAPDDRAIDYSLERLRERAPRRKGQ
jgi:tetratricopeptide (TPR) repeat protein